MSKMRFRRKNVKSFLSAILVVAVVVGAIAGLAALSNRDLKEIHPMFSVGGINVDGPDRGEHMVTDQSIYTKNAFECKGLTIKLDFDSHIKYRVYFYDELDRFVSASPTSDDAMYEESIEFDVPSRAKLARLVIEPIWSSDTASKNRKVNWYDVLKYANQMSVYVSADQDSVDVEGFENELLSATEQTVEVLGKGSYSGFVFNEIEASPWNCTAEFDATDYTEAIVLLDNDTLTGKVMYNEIERDAFFFMDIGNQVQKSSLDLSYIVLNEEKGNVYISIDLTDVETFALMYDDVSADVIKVWFK